jgi:hypothetical protein
MTIFDCEEALLQEQAHRADGGFVDWIARVPQNVV